jgi:hypothetical protein
MADSNAQQQLLEQFMSIAQCSEDKGGPSIAAGRVISTSNLA